MPKDGEIVIPLKRHYDAINFAVEGMSGAMSSDDVVFDLPAYPDGDPEQSGEDPADEQDQGGVDPTERKGGTLDRGDPFGYGTDSMGRKYPVGKYGPRIVPGSRRPEGGSAE